MSLWSDIQDRSAGITIRKEDEYQNAWETLSAPLTYMGPINMSTIPAFPKAGEIYFVQDDISINNKSFPSGCMILFDGNNWMNVGYYQETKIDSNIGYYQPIDVQESSII